MRSLPSGSAADLADLDEALPQAFFDQPTRTVARALLGMRLCHRLPSGELRAGRIIEVEAYLGPEDKASHARLQRRRGGLYPTPRSAVMFGPCGHAYVYLIYGMHTCFNVVAHAPGAVGAVLIRALDPEPPLLPTSCRGPARLCVALAIERRHNDCLLHAPVRTPELATALPSSSMAPPEPERAPDSPPGESRLWIAQGEPFAEAAVAAGPRIGVEYAGEDALLPYRLGVRGHPHLSRPI